MNPQTRPVRANWPHSNERIARVGYKTAFVVGTLMSVPVANKEAEVTRLCSKELTDLRNKEGLMITVVYPPGSSDPIHRHNPHALGRGKIVIAFSA